MYLLQVNRCKVRCACVCWGGGVESSMDDCSRWSFSSLVAGAALPKHGPGLKHTQTLHAYLMSSKPCSFLSLDISFHAETTYHISTSLFNSGLTHLQSQEGVEPSICHLLTHIFTFPDVCHRCFRRWICRMGSGDTLISVLFSIRRGIFVTVAVGQSWIRTHVCMRARVLLCPLLRQASRRKKRAALTEWGEGWDVK